MTKILDDNQQEQQENQQEMTKILDDQKGPLD